MRIAILGAGSLGCVFGGLLAEAGHNVLLVNRNQSLVDHLNSTGLTLDLGEGATRLIPVRAATVCAADGPVDLLIVLVKSFDTRTALEAAKDAIGPETIVLSLQNGLGHEELIAPFVGADRVLLGKTYVGGTMTEPGVVIGGIGGKLTFIGPVQGSVQGPVSAAVQAVADNMSAAGLETVASPRILNLAWDKLLVNVSTSGLSALSGLSYGPLYDTPEIEACAIAAVAEAMQVAAAIGVEVSFTAPEEAWTLAAKGLPAGFKASMLQSVEHRRRTEIDFIHGAVVRLGKRHNIPTPVNATLVAAVKGLERNLLEQD